MNKAGKKKMTVGKSIFTGVFGMNVHFPGFDTAAAFWVIVGAMFGLAVGLIAFFRGKRWL